VFADRSFDSESLFSFNSDSEAVTTVPNWGDLPVEMQKKIFQYVEPGQYLHITLTCKLFRELYMARTYQWNITLYRNGAASIECAALAMQLYPERFDKSKYRLCLILGAIQNNRPDVVEWMFANNWFWYVSADKCAKHGHVKVLVWMWLHGSFSDLDSDDYDPTLAKYFNEDLSLNIIMVKYMADCDHCYGFIPGPSTLEMERQFRECNEHVHSAKFWGINCGRD
jgi:hypothetical protein